ncbi:hypothetical protein D3C76_1303740 [compost metagenome]
MILVNSVNDATGNIARAFGIAVRQQQAELIPAEARQHVGGAQHTEHQRRQLPEQRIPRRVACRVVDRLKAVEIDKHQRMTLTGILHGV